MWEAEEDEDEDLLGVEDLFCMRGAVEDARSDRPCPKDIVPDTIGCAWSCPEAREVTTGMPTGMPKLGLKALARGGEGQGKV